MNGPNDLDDGWAELARELGLEGDRPFPSPEPDHPAADLHPPEDAAPEADDDDLVEVPGEAPTPDDVFADADADDRDAEADGDDADVPDEGDEGETTGEPGEPKKKRRRRRRRKKKPGEAAAPTGEPAEEPEPAAEAEEPDDAGEPALPDDGLVEEEGATPAATRELIANWDVPSWETIVNTMLFRPQGR